MTVDDALKAMGAIDGQHDGTADRAAIVETLHRKLLEDPEEFWDAYFTNLDATRPNPYRDQAVRLLCSGAVNDETTFGDIPAVLAWDAALTESGGTNASR